MACMPAAAPVYEWLKLDREVTSQLRVRGWEKLSRGTVAAKPVAHPDAVELTLVEEGTLRYEVGGREIVASAGQIVVVPREVLHATSFLTPMRGVALWLGGDLVAEVADSMGPGVRGSLLRASVLPVSTTRIQRLLRVLVDEVEEASIGHTRAAEALAESVVIEMLRRAPHESPATKKSARDPRVLSAIAQMHASYSEPLSVDDLAKTAKMSRFHFSRLFRDEVGQAPYQYLLQVRLAHAAELLRSGHHSVTEAALSAGFTDFSRFSKMFRKYAGRRPHEVMNGARIA